MDRHLKVKIPNWAVNKHLYVFAGTELLAYQDVYTLQTVVKGDSGRCSGCGECCEDGNPFNPHQWEEFIKRVGNYSYSQKLPCPFLDPQKGCSLGNNIPFACSKAICSHYKKCTERLE